MRATCVSCLTKGSPDKEQGVASKTNWQNLRKAPSGEETPAPQYVLPTSRILLLWNSSRRVMEPGRPCVKTIGPETSGKLTSSHETQHCRGRRRAWLPGPAMLPHRRLFICLYSGRRRRSPGRLHFLCPARPWRLAPSCGSFSDLLRAQWIPTPLSAYFYLLFYFQSSFSSCSA